MSQALYGIIGYPLSHSFSPKYFAQKFREEGINAEYRAFALKDITDFPQLLQDYPCIKGLNVTIPYKEQILPYLDELDSLAEQLRAVNTIRINKGRLVGYNTDVIGFRSSLEKRLQPHHKRALVLGTGGASKAVRWVLQELGISALPVSRKPAAGTLAYAHLDADLIARYPLIINTTPLGTWPEVNACPELPYEDLSPRHLLFDLVYNPEQTLFLQRGDRQGAATCNGLEMLTEQANAAWEIWTA